MKKLVGVVFISTIVAVVFVSYLLFIQSGIRKELTLRDVTLYDTSSVSYQNKNTTTLNTKGFFVDKSTGLKFSDVIQDKLYREFEEGKNKPIEMQKEFSLDTIEGSSLGPAYKFFGAVLLLATIVFSGGFLITQMKSKPL